MVLKQNTKPFLNMAFSTHLLAKWVWCKSFKQNALIGLYSVLVYMYSQSLTPVYCPHVFTTVPSLQGHSASQPLDCLTTNWRYIFQSQQLSSKGCTEGRSQNSPHSLTTLLKCNSLSAQCLFCGYQLNAYSVESSTEVPWREQRHSRQGLWILYGCRFVS